MSEQKEAKTRLQIALEKKARLLEEAKEAEIRIRRLKAKAEKIYAVEKRNAEKHLKTHIGGMVEMTGLMQYVYPADIEPDNPQDRLIANLLVGVFLSVGISLEHASADDLEKLWKRGKEFRSQKKDDRLLAKVNQNLQLLFDKLGLMKTATKQQPNVDVQSNAQASVIES